MGSESEPAKLLLPFLQRADELQKHEPLVAYYCRLYAMERGLRIPQKERTKTTNALLISLMNQLEKDKKSIKLGPEDNLYVEGFASNVFAKADKQDRAGRADLNTAKTFYAASIFFEILTQFGDLQPDIEQKLKYAVWKAADIRRAIKEGRKPEPGPPGGERDLSIPSSSPTNSYDLGHSQSLPSSQPNAGTPYHQEMGRSESFTAGYQGADIPSQVSDGLNPRGNENFTASYPGADHLSQPLDRVTHPGSSQPPPSPPSFPSTDYPPPGDDYHQFAPPNIPDMPPSYPQPPYHQQSYSNDQQPTPQNYHPEDSTPPSPYSYPNFQSYPSFHETTFPSAPTHQPTYYHGATTDASYTRQSSAPSVSNYLSPSPVNYDDSGSNGSHVAPPGPAVPSYKYDPNYQPPVEKIAEAHKAARFAVGALAFDDVAVAVDFLQKSLELLTNPSAEAH